MKIEWTDHALVRAKERGPVWGLFRALIERAIESREWEEWFEVDRREDRGLKTNLVVRATDGTSAVVRISGDDGAYLVVSVLTAEQYKFNSEQLWSKTADRALAHAAKEEADGRLGLSPTRALTHSPFAVLAQKRKS